MDKNKLKVAAAFSSFTLAVVSLGGVTLAWYATANEVQISNLDYSLHDDSGTLQFGLKLPSKYSSISDFQSDYPQYVDDVDGDEDSAKAEWQDDIFYFNGPITTQDLINFRQLKADESGEPETKLTPCTSGNISSWLGSYEMNIGDDSTENKIPVYYNSSISKEDFNDSYPSLYKMPTITNKNSSEEIGKTNLGTDSFGYTSREVDDYFYQFEIYVRSTNAEVFVFLSNLTSVSADTSSNVKTAKTSKYTVDQLNNVKNYIRISYYSYFDYTSKDTDINENGVKTTKDAHEVSYAIYDPSPSGLKTRYYGPLDLVHDGIFDVEGKQYKDDMYYENSDGELVYGNPDKDEGAYREIMYGNYNDASKIVYKSPTGKTPAHDTSHIGSFFAVTWGNAYAIDLDESDDNGFTGQAEKATTADGIYEESSKRYYYQFSNALAYASRESNTRVVISVWAEGWDLDCDESSSLASFTANIQLSGRDKDQFQTK